MIKARHKYRVWDEEDQKDVSSRVFVNHLGEVCVIRHGGFFRHERTVEYCTGLKDKHGKLIYEGDVVRVIIAGMFDIGMTFEVVDCVSHWQIRDLANGRYHNLDIGCIFEIIGNIRDDQFREVTKKVEGN